VVDSALEVSTQVAIFEENKRALSRVGLVEEIDTEG